MGVNPIRASNLGARLRYSQFLVPTMAMPQVDRRRASALHVHVLYPGETETISYSKKRESVSLKGARKEARAFERSDTTLCFGWIRCLPVRLAKPT